MNKQAVVEPMWRPQIEDDTARGWNEQLSALEAHEAEVANRIAILTRGRGTLLVSGSSDEIATAERALAFARSEADRIPVMREELVSRRNAALARESIATLQQKRAELLNEVHALAADVRKFDRLVAPLVNLLKRDKEVHERVEEFNQRYRAVAAEYALDLGDLLPCPVRLYATDRGAYPIHRQVRIPAGDLSSWLWNMQPGI